MICKSYMELTPKEKSEYIGKVVHAIQSDEVCFISGKELIEYGEMKGLFNNTTLLPENCDKELKDLDNPIS